MSGRRRTAAQNQELQDAQRKMQAAGVGKAQRRRVIAALQERQDSQLPVVKWQDEHADELVEPADPSSPGYYSPSDRGYRPPKTDSLLVGQARAVGWSAKAVKRGRTFTQYQTKETP